MVSLSATELNPWVNITSAVPGDAPPLHQEADACAAAGAGLHDVIVHDHVAVRPVCAAHADRLGHGHLPPRIHRLQKTTPHCRSPGKALM